MKLLKDSGFGPSTLFFTSLTVALGLALVLMLGRGSQQSTLIAVAVLTVSAAWLAYRSRRHGRAAGSTSSGFWVSWLERPGADETHGAARGPRERRSMLPYIGWFALFYVSLVLAAALVSSQFGFGVPLLVYLLFIVIADQVTSLQFARRVGRPYFREELVGLYSGTGLIIVLSEFPTLMALSMYGQWRAELVTGFALVAAIAFTVHYFALTKLPAPLLRNRGH